MKAPRPRARPTELGPPSRTQASTSPYLAALEWLHRFADYERKPGGHVFSLERPRLLLEWLGNPQTAYRCVVVAGTKGKGSTAIMLQALLRATGHSVGLYTQPHLHTYRERVRVDEALIEPAEVARGVEQLAPAVERVHRARPDLGRLTTYEIGTALALAHFARRGVDWAVLEVGLGGRLDAVNAVNSSLAVLTPISLDHTEVLGDTVEQIAREKAGIIHPNGRVVSAPQPDEAMAVISQACRERAATLRTVDGESISNLRLRRLPAGLSLAAMRSAPLVEFEAFPSGVSVALALGGRHQALNAAVALTAAAECGARLDPASIRQALVAVRWPGRLEVLGDRPTIVVDGAHNGASAQALAHAVRDHFAWERLTLVIGTSADKDLAAILAPLLPLAERVIATQASHPRALPAAEVVRQAAARHRRAEPAASVADAVRAAREGAGGSDLVLVTGSLFVVAEARAALGWAEPGP